jgi:hypothetical protein
MSTNFNQRLQKKLADDERRIEAQREQRLRKQRQRINEDGVRDGRVTKTPTTRDNPARRG